jgi:ABC-2 type transport system permease protein
LKLFAISLRTGLQQEMIFRSDFFMGIVQIVLRAVLMVALWNALYAGKSVIDGITMDTMIFYALSAIIFEILISSNIEGVVSGDIQSGNISLGFARPLKYPASLMMGQLSFTGVNIILRVIPYSIILAVIYFISAPDITFSGMFVLSSLLSYILFSLYQMVFGLISFWTMEITGVLEARDAAMLVFSGSLIPLWFFPDWLFSVARYLPFQAMFHTPLSILINKLEDSDAIWSVVVQGIWILAFSLILIFVWRRAKRRVVVNGG